MKPLELICQIPFKPHMFVALMHLPYTGEVYFGGEDTLHFTIYLPVARRYFASFGMENLTFDALMHEMYMEIQDAQVSWENGKRYERVTKDDQPEHAT